MADDEQVVAVWHAGARRRVGELVRVSRNHEIDAGVVGYVNPRLIPVRKPAPTRLMHRDDAERG